MREIRVLAAFLNDETAAGLPEFASLHIDQQQSIQQRFGRRPSDETNPTPRPEFRCVREPAVLDLLQAVATECAGPPALSNLVGFEWINIASLVAGHLVTAPLPPREHLPRGEATAEEIAQYCIFGIPPNGIEITPLGNVGLLSSTAFRFALGGFELRPGQLLVQYAMQPVASPVAVALLEHRPVAVRHLERLVCLHEAGAKDALCMVFYGYGMQMLQRLPTVPPNILDCARPPMVSDFSDHAMSVGVPVPAPRVVSRFFHDVLQLNPSAR